METWFQELIQNAASAPFLAYATLLVLAFLETVPILGLFIPGTMIVLFAGFIAVQAPIHLPFLMGASVIGTALGYQWGFMLGKKYGRRLLSERWHLLGKEEFDRTHQFFEKYGSISVVLGRFFGPVRPFMPFVAGMGSMTQERFRLMNWISSVLWGAGLVLLGFYLGDRYAEVGNVKIKITLLILAIGVIPFLPKLVRTLHRHWKHHRNPPDIA